MTASKEFNEATTDEIIFRQLQQLPEALKSEVLDFIGFLATKHNVFVQKANGSGASITLASEQLLHENSKHTEPILLLENQEVPFKNAPKFGFMKGLVLYMAPDFNEPLEDFAEYM